MKRSLALTEYRKTTQDTTLAIHKCYHHWWFLKGGGGNSIVGVVSCVVYGIRVDTDEYTEHEYGQTHTCMYSCTHLVQGEDLLGLDGVDDEGGPGVPRVEHALAQDAVAVVVPLVREHHRLVLLRDLQQSSATATIEATTPTLDGNDYNDNEGANKPKHTQKRSSQALTWVVGWLLVY